MIEEAIRFLRIDDKIHSRSEDTPWTQVEADAEEYTAARKALKLAIKAAQHEEGIMDMNLNGTWKVEVTSGPLWFRSLNWLRDQKVIKDSSGYNIMAGVKWGSFKISQDREKFVFTYTNGLIVDKVQMEATIDMLDLHLVRHINKNKLVGKFYWKGSHIGNFDMMRRI